MAANRDCKNKLLEMGNETRCHGTKDLGRSSIDRTQFTNLVKMWETHESKFFNHRSGRCPLAILRDDFREMESTVLEIRDNQPNVVLVEVEIEAYAKIVRPVKIDYNWFLGTGHDRSRKHFERERLHAYILGNMTEHNAHYPSRSSGSTRSGGSHNGSDNQQRSGIGDGDGIFTNASIHATPLLVEILLSAIMVMHKCVHFHHFHSLHKYGFTILMKAKWIHFPEISRCQWSNHALH